MLWTDIIPNLAFTFFHLEITVIDGHPTSSAILLHFPTKWLSWMKQHNKNLLKLFYASVQRHHLVPGLHLLVFISRCWALFSSGLSVYHCVSGSKVWICHCISMPRLKHTLNIILPQSKLSIYIKHFKKWFYWIFIVLCFCYILFCAMLTHLPIDILYSLHKD